MTDSLLLDGAGQVLRDGLSGLAKRQQLIAGNISNMDTPGYRSSDIAFEAALQQQLGQGQGLPMFRTASMHIDGTADRAARLGTVAEKGNPFQSDGTGVDVDYEMARLSETTIRYDTLTQLLAGKIALLRSAVTEGRR
jgi:flagellar basal-body rod protein FlgB